MRCSDSHLRRKADMEIQVIHPTLEDYSKRVNFFATKYGQDTWLAFTLDPSVMDDDDRDEFAFIHSAVGDQLISREFDLMSAAFSPEEVIDEKCDEPGGNPGSLVLAGDYFERSRIYRVN
jgi:hypothetical protein